MSGIRSSNTKPELLLRRGLHKMGFRFRLHSKRLPGKPDLVFPKYRSVIFVHGCFWHGHQCHLFKWPKSRDEFWRQKIEGNILRDRRKEDELLKTGWRIGIVRECALKGRTKLPVEMVLSQCSKWLRGNERIMELKGL